MSEIEDAFGFNDKPTELQVEKCPNEIGDNYAEIVISVFAYATLVIGCLVSLACGISFMDYDSTQGLYLMDHDSAQVLGLVIIVGGIICSVISWALLMVIANISNNIRQIKHELKKRNSKDKEA